MLLSAAEVELKLYDLMGREVMQIDKQHYPAGGHSVLLRADDLAGGVYFVKMYAGGWERAKKLILLK